MKSYKTKQTLQPLPWQGYRHRKKEYRQLIFLHAREFHRILSDHSNNTMPTGRPLRTTLSNTTASEPSENRSLTSLCNANIYIYDRLSRKEAFQSLLSLALQVLYRRLRTKQLERLATEHADDRQARLQRLRTCVRRLNRMALPQARPTMLCIQ